MKTFSLILLVIAAAIAVPVDQEQDDADGWFVPQIDGTLEWMTVEELESLENQRMPTGRRAAAVHFFLYTDDNVADSQQIITGHSASLHNSNFNEALPTRIIIHGWQNNANSDVCIQLRDALLETGSYNVICVDWSDKAETINYAGSVLRVPEIGKKVAAFIDFLHEEGGMSFETLIVMGHSLGAHVSGYAGKNVQLGRVQQITGLDPAYPLFTYNKAAKRLSDNDAEYVETIHTCGGLLGILKPVGVSSFYPNGGKSQPGCGVDLTGSCAHSRSYEYYAEAIRQNSFPAVTCGTYKDAVGKKCGSAYSSVKMGSSTNYINANGEFFVPVNKNSPFGKAQ